ncbi:GGDEF domain-containing protein [Novipirellula artificiosorum]|uniref:diguanylate cyclase n=1 Tax=Novipirellula artificiosorum TaxID=2528016 RepID=A0A5C6E1P8_9BACT|nr:GGDEF domain-containing protein [Novipirellula artificiosorum]TWU42820.1 putative diguanylate cyclase AdrA [Novipirellula artificiosorum]
MMMAGGLSLALVLLVIGIAIGLRLARRQSKTNAAMSQDERERMLQMLHELGAWTSEYSGNVSQYQSRLGELSDAVRVDPAVHQAAPKVVSLLQQIMDSNSQLKSRLDAAERQLDKQTKQIESYLTEARTDGLTGLYNRRAFDQRLDELFAAFRKGGRSFVFVLVDIDHFKSFNDTHGHQVGDQVLQQVAKTLRLELQESIMVARFGGEEFSVLMNGPLRIAAEKMNEVRKKMAALQIEIGAKKLSVTISVGLTEPRDDLVVSPVVRRADEALYAAKNIGRNRVYYHDGKGAMLVGAPEVARG